MMDFGTIKLRGTSKRLKCLDWDGLWNHYLKLRQGAWMDFGTITLRDTRYSKRLKCLD